MSTKTRTGNGEEKGRGGNFKGERNPFRQEREQKGQAPEMRESPDMLQALDAALKAGNAVLVGHTRDGGALVITILAGELRFRTYCATTEELDDAATRMIQLYAE